MRIIALKTLRLFWERHANSRPALEAWYDHARHANWNSPQDLVREYGQDGILPENRVVFKIKGNDYRLVVKINYSQKLIYIRFIGTHAEYDKIDATTI
jgi:mRNA interferase HigB